MARQGAVLVDEVESCHTTHTYCTIDRSAESWCPPMPILRNARHEQFAQQLAGGATAIDAHRAAGFRADRGNATRLQQNDSIRQRVAEILAEREAIHGQATARAIERTGSTKQWVIDQLRENVERAMQAQPVLDRAGRPTGMFIYNGAAANRALELLGKEMGMFIDRREVRNVDEFEKMDEVELDKWLSDYAKVGRGARDKAH